MILSFTAGNNIKRIDSISGFKKLIIIVWLQVMFVLTASATVSFSDKDIKAQWKIKHFTVDQGLSYNFVHSICQDKFGYIWIATSYGLNRFDGLHFKKYFSDKHTSGSLSSNYIWSVFLDSDSVLWIGTTHGLHYYDDRQEVFVRVRVPDDRKDREVFVIKEDSRKNLLFGTSTGLYSCKTSDTTLYRIDIKQYGAPYDSIYRIVIDKHDNLWMSSYNKGLYYYNRSSNEIDQYRANKAKQNALSDDYIFNLYIDANETLWIGTYNSGICRFNADDSTFSRYVIDEDYEFTKRIRTIFEDRYGRLFFGTRDGLFLFNKQTEQFYLYANDAHDVSKLSQNSVTYSYIDWSGGIWLGTHSGGVSYIDMFQKDFALSSFKNNSDDFLNTGAIHCFAETEDKLFVGTEKGLCIKDKKSDKYTYLKHQVDNSKSLTYDDVKDIEIETENKIWVATNRGGLHLLNEKGEVVKVFRHDPDNPNSLPSDNLYNVYIDHTNTLWVITNADWDRLTSVLSRYDRETDKFYHYKDEFFMGFYPDADSSFLVGGVHGYFKYNRKADSFESFTNDSLIFRVMTLYQDKHMNTWIGSNTGLTRHMFKTSVFEDISDRLDITFEEVFGLIPQDSNLWVSTNNGLFIIKNSFSSTGNIDYKRFDRSDGLQSREFNYNAYFRSEDNRVFFGGDNGFNYFFPDQIKDNPFKPRVYISALRVAGKTIKPGQIISGNQRLKSSVYYPQNIKLKYRSGAITLFFNVLHFANPHANTFKFKLIGLDSDWNYSNAASNFITYHKLLPGAYKFMVYGINADGIESEDPAVINITILPPFWQTLWFRLLMFFLLITSVIIIIQRRTFTLRRQRKILQINVKRKTHQLEQSNKNLKEKQEEVLSQNEEIKSQHDTILEKSELLEKLYNKSKMLNAFGAELTASFEMDSIIYIIYNSLKGMIELSAFGIGLNEREEILYNHFIEAGNLLPSFSVSVKESSTSTANCFNNSKTLVLNKADREQGIIDTKTLQTYKSLVFVPLLANNKKLGVVTFQSHKKNAYPDTDIPIIQSIATFIAVALDNAHAYKLIEQQNEDLELHKNSLQQLIKERTAELETAMHKAEESDRLKSAFLANMSHEIRTPLNAIIGFIDLLYSNAQDEKNIKFFDIIKSSSLTLLKLLDDIIDFAQIESGEVSIRISEVDIPEILNDQYISFKQVLESNNIESQQDVTIELINRVVLPEEKYFSDEHRIIQILSNLLGNAIKFTHAGSIRFGIDSYEAGMCTIYVEDTGIGIDKSDFKDIFKRFRKLEHKTEKLYRGGGLGLSISKNLVTLLGGRIWVTSDPGVGSTFYFCFSTDNS